MFASSVFESTFREAKLQYNNSNLVSIIYQKSMHMPRRQLHVQNNTWEVAPHT